MTSDIDLYMHSTHSPTFAKTRPRSDAQSIDDATASVRRQLALAENHGPCIGVILGSGLGSAAHQLLASGGKSLPYASIPGMPVPHVNGHHGKLVYGHVHGILTIMLQGRIHSYEGHALPSVQFGTRLLHALGAHTFIVTNAAGGIRDEFMPGDLMIINNHLRPLAASWMRWNSIDHAAVPAPLVESANGRGVLVPSASDLLWNESLQNQVRGISSSLRIHEGVYAMMTGPNYETPAEIRAMQRFGADAVGMSTVPEALLAAELGMRVLGVSCITNVAAGLSANSLSHLDVTTTAARIETPFAVWLGEVIKTIGERPTSVH